MNIRSILAVFVAVSCSAPVAAQFVRIEAARTSVLLAAPIVSAAPAGLTSMSPIALPGVPLLAAPSLLAAPGALFTPAPVRGAAAPKAVLAGLAAPVRPDAAPAEMETRQRGTYDGSGTAPATESTPVLAAPSASPAPRVVLARSGRLSAWTPSLLALAFPAVASASTGGAANALKVGGGLIAGAVLGFVVGLILGKRNQGPGDYSGPIGVMFCGIFGAVVCAIGGAVLTAYFLP